MIDWNHRELTVTEQAGLLDVSRSTIYYRPASVMEEEAEFKRRILALYLAHPYYGSRRIAAVMRREGCAINRKRVQRLMRELGIQGICPGPNLSRRNIKQGISPYLLNGMEASRPNEVWAIDITYIRLCQGFVYLASIIDLYSRYIIAWDISTTLEAGFILETVMRALPLAKPEIFNSDQGSQFTSPQYVELLNSSGVRISMDGKNRALDNVFIERFWRSAKWECVYLSEFESPRDVRRGIAEYVCFYNWERPHQSLGYQVPAEVYHAEPIVAA